MYRGRSRDVIFIGSSVCHKWRKEAKVYYVINSEAPPLCFMVQSHVCPSDVIFEFTVSHWLKNCNVMVDDPILIVRKSREDENCIKVGKNTNITNYPNRTTFIITRQPIPDDILTYCGWLWTCYTCGHGTSYKRNCENHIIKEKHDWLFKDNMPPAIWGHEKTKFSDKAWAEPSDRRKLFPVQVFKNHEIVEYSSPISVSKNLNQKLKPSIICVKEVPPHQAKDRSLRQKTLVASIKSTDETEQQNLNSIENDTVIVEDNDT